MATLGTGVIVFGFFLGYSAAYRAYRDGPRRRLGLVALGVLAAEALAAAVVLLLPPLLSR